ncbi:MAG TPA: glycosyltransferase [Gemmatimonadales bacterium]|nr:glycosyltransferase [Gemmatimonadales bacterium]
MRILHLAKYYWPRSGGMERVVQGLAEGAAGLGHQVEVVAVETLGRAGSSGRQRSSVTRAFSLAALGSQEIAPGYIAAAWGRADIIHVHHPHPLADLACLLRARRTPVVVTQHADSRRSIYRPATRLVLRRAAAVVVPSRAHLALSNELIGYESKVEVIPFGIDQSRWELVPPPPPGAAPRAIFIGRLVGYKGLDILLRALERVPELRLDIVGSGPEGPRLRTLAQALAITDRVRWYGEYPDEDLPRRMADADFLVLPSVTVEEMFGLVVLEAMAAGRPVVTTALPSAVREVNVPGETGLEVPLRDVPALANALETLSHDPALRKRMGEAGRKRVAERFTQTAMAEKHISLYERIRAERR